MGRLKLQLPRSTHPWGDLEGHQCLCFSGEGLSQAQDQANLH